MGCGVHLFPIGLWFGLGPARYRVTVFITASHCSIRIATKCTDEESIDLQKQHLARLSSHRTNPATDDQRYLLHIARTNLIMQMSISLSLSFSLSLSICLLLALILMGHLRTLWTHTHKVCLVHKYSIPYSPPHLHCTQHIRFTAITGADYHGVIIWHSSAANDNRNAMHIVMHQHIATGRTSLPT